MKVSPLNQGGDLNQSSVFQSAVDFFNKTIFHKDVTFATTTTFDGDSAGLAIIPAGGREVSIVFDSPYDAPPVVTASPLWDDTTGSLDVMRQLGDTVLPNQKYIISDDTVNGFTILLESTASADLKFSWKAVGVK